MELRFIMFLTIRSLGRELLVTFCSLSQNRA